MLRQQFVYLCGPITGCTFQGCSDWREYVKLKLEDVQTPYIVQGHKGDCTYNDRTLLVPKFHCFNPMRGEEEFLKDRGKVPIPSRHEGLAPHPLADDRVQCVRDFWDVRNADILFVNVTDAKVASIGTVGEVAIGWHLGKFILVIGEPGNIHTEHGLFREWASLILPTVDEGIEYLTKVLYR